MNLVIESGLRLAAPILLAALGATLSLLAGDLNLGLEGLMLLGAFTAFTADYWFQSWLMGLLCALAVMVVLGALYGQAVTRRWGNPYMLGIVLNIFANSATVVLLWYLFGVKGSFSSPDVVAVPSLRFPAWLSAIPIFGGFFATQPITVYLSLMLAALIALVLYRTPFGLHIRSAGQNPKGLASSGVHVPTVRIWASVLNTALCGLAGVHLSLGQLQLFSAGMTAGRGFVALAAAIFAKGRIGLLVILSVVFGGAESLSLRLQQAGVPAHFPLMMPYIATLLLLAGTAYQQRKKRIY